MFFSFKNRGEDESEAIKKFIDKNIRLLRHIKELRDLKSNLDIVKYSHLQQVLKEVEADQKKIEQIIKKINPQLSKYLKKESSKVFK